MTSLPDGFARLHTDARALLTRWAPPDDAQDSLRAAYLRHLDAHPDAMWRDGPADHFTAGVFVYDHALERVLLVLHKKAHLWLQVGGHLEAHDTSVAEAARREATEESGLPRLAMTPQLVHLSHHDLSSAFGRCRSHLDLRFAAVAAEGAVPQVSDESDGIGWWPLDDLPEPTDPALGTAIRAARDALTSRTPQA